MRAWIDTIKYRALCQTNCLRNEWHAKLRLKHVINLCLTLLLNLMLLIKLTWKSNKCATSLKILYKLHIKVRKKIMYGLSLNYIGHHSKLVLELGFEIVAFVFRAKCITSLMVCKLYFTWGQFCPSSVVVACICVCSCVCASQSELVDVLTGHPLND